MASAKMMMAPEPLALAEQPNPYSPMPPGAKIIGDYSCGWVKKGGVAVSGRMFISESHVAFRAQFFGSDTNVLIPVENIESVVKKNSALVLPNAIQLNTSMGKFFFTSFLQRDQAFNIIHSLLTDEAASDEEEDEDQYSESDVNSDDYSSDESPTPPVQKKQASAPTVPISSTTQKASAVAPPAAAAPASAAPQVQQVPQQQQVQTPASTTSPAPATPLMAPKGFPQVPPSPVVPHQRTTSVQAPSGMVVPVPVHQRTISIQPSLMQSAASTQPAVASMDASAGFVVVPPGGLPTKVELRPPVSPSPRMPRMQPTAIETPPSPKSTAKDAEVSPLQIAEPSPSSPKSLQPATAALSAPVPAPAPVGESAASALPEAVEDDSCDSMPNVTESACEHMKKTDEKHILTETFAVSPSTFFKLFLSTKSRFWETCQETVCGVIDLETEPWKPIQGCNCFQKKMTFTKPLNHPLVSKKWTKGLTLSATVTLTPAGEIVYHLTLVPGKDVPYGDYFYTHCVWLITPGKEPETCQATVHQSITFIKSTWMKGAIERGSITETAQVAIDIATRMREAIAARTSGLKQQVQNAQPAAITADASGDHGQQQPAEQGQQAAAAELITYIPAGSAGTAAEGSSVPNRIWLTLLLLALVSIFFVSFLFFRVSAQSEVIADAWITINDATKRIDTLAVKLGVPSGDEWQTKVDTLKNALDGTREVLHALEALAEEQKAALEPGGGWTKVLIALFSTVVAALTGLFCLRAPRTT